MGRWRTSWRSECLMPSLSRMYMPVITSMTSCGVGTVCAFHPCTVINIRSRQAVLTGSGHGVPLPRWSAG